MAEKRKFISQKGMADLRRGTAIIHSRINREGQNAYPTIIPCGCPAQDCGGIAIEKQQAEYDGCLIRAFFEKQKELPPSMRSNAAYIYCPCKRCNPFTW